MFGQGEEGRRDNHWSSGIVFFYKQKTAYEVLRSLVVLEMCIRDSSKSALFAKKPEVPWPYIAVKPAQIPRVMGRSQSVKRKREAKRYK